MKNTPESACGWPDCPEAVRAGVNDILDCFRRIFGKDLVGFYLHGSLAMGCYNPRTSDVDFLAVVRRGLIASEKRAIIGFLADIPEIRTEMSIVTVSNVSKFAYLTPYELHYNHDHREKYENGTFDFTAEQCDEDLIMHFLAIRRRGICLYGTAIEAIFPEITREMCLPAIAREIDWINDRLDTLPPTYTVLNPCRAVAFLREDKLMSKPEGGVWALVNFPPRFAATIRRALAVYAGNEIDEPFANDILHDMVACARREIGQFLTGQITKK
jgi:predicted nucleotidyltransferase